MRVSQTISFHPRQLHTPVKDISTQVIIVMPAYNEAACIEKVVGDWLGIAKSLGAARIYVVNDGSTDATGLILDRMAINQPLLSVFHQKKCGAWGSHPLWIFSGDQDGGPLGCPGG